MSSPGLVALVFGAAAMAVFLVGAIGTGRGWWRHVVGFAFAAVAALLSAATIGRTLFEWFWAAAGASSPLDAALGIVGLAACAMSLFMPLAFAFKVLTTPWIHDLTTDFVSPPSLEWARRLRPLGSDSVEYPGEKAAQIQRAHYPEVQPLVVPASVADAARRGRAAAVTLGWDIIRFDASSGELEAIVVSRLFGFRDDVAVRCAPVDDGTRIDVRSASRVGDTDLGVNAKRIVSFLDAVRESVARREA